MNRRRHLFAPLLTALLTPHARLKSYQDEGDFTSMLAMQEELKFYPFAAVWDEFCERQGVPVRESVCTAGRWGCVWL